MNVIHRTTIRCCCPVNQAADLYTAEFETDRVVRVEDIQAAIDDLTKAPCFQEQLTEALRHRLGCKVTTRGSHGGFATTVVCE